MRTYQARFQVDAESAALNAYGALFGRAVRTLYAQHRAGIPQAKSRFMREFDLPSRQYNAVKATLDGMESSIRELRPLQIADLKHRIEAITKNIQHESKPEKLYHLKRRMASLQTKRDRLQEASRNNVTC
ncbi:MAG: hypothetical protein ACYDHD_01505 [Vulcanimicrobiaceae bacterium]